MHCLRTDGKARHERPSETAEGATDNGGRGLLEMENEKGASSASERHVLMFPFPVQGHINPMLRLAGLLCLSGIKHVTFLNTHHNHRLLVAHNRHMLGSHHPGIRFRFISDGLPDDDNDRGPRPANRILELHKSLAAVFPHQLLGIVGDRSSICACCEHTGDLGARDDRELLPPVTCAVVDGLMSFAIDACLEAALPVVAFRTPSACSFLVYNSYPNLIQAGELPFPADGDRCDLDEPIRSVPGMDGGLLRRRDLPKSVRAKDLKDDPVMPWLHRQNSHASQATVVLLNTFEALESPVLTVIRSGIPHTIAVGPIHALLLQLRSSCQMQPISKDSLQRPPPVAKDQEPAGSSNRTSSIRMSLWEEDSSCIAWLDQQPPKSVVFVSFGSLAVMTKELLLELWHGLLASGQRFLWVLRSEALAELAAANDPHHGADTRDGHGRRQRDGVVLPSGNDDQQGRYLLVNWAPQEEVLNHPSVGGFFTHSGWNSTLESAVAGVPMLCWPFSVDQHVNSRFVEHVWKIGIDIKDVCDRDQLAGAVRCLMQGPKAEELRAAVTDLAVAAKAAVAPGGSSYSDFHKLVQCIKLDDFSPLASPDPC